MRLLVSGRDGEVSHRVFRELPGLLRAGDVLVVNTSRTLPAAVDGRVARDRDRGEPVVVHFSTRGDDGRWAVESAAGADGLVRPAAGWTDLVVTPGRGVRVVDGLLTGLHEPEASHLLMLEAVAGREPLARGYAAALAERYLWHEFGDAHLILNRTPGVIRQPHGETGTAADCEARHRTHITYEAG